MQKDIKSKDEPEDLSHTLGQSLIHQSLKTLFYQVNFFKE